MQKLALLPFCVLFVSCGSAEGNSKFLPENELWREDCVACEANTMTEAIFNKIVDAGRKAYASKAANNNEQLIINARWTDATVNADCSRYNGRVTVNMYGGLARRREISIEGFALVLGHELSHAYGGAPYYPNSQKMSGEGQSDYVSAKTAYGLIAPYASDLRQTIPVAAFVANACKNKKSLAYTDCVHTLEGGKTLGALLAVLSGEPVPRYETPDTSVVSKTETSYPNTVQCRVDSYLAGVLNKARPSCWFYK